MGQCIIPPLVIFIPSYHFSISIYLLLLRSYFSSFLFASYFETRGSVEGNLFSFFFFFSFWFDFVVTGMIDFSNNTHTELSVYTIPQRETKKHYDNVINWRNIEQLFVFQQLALMIDFFFFSSTDLSSSSAC